MMIIMIVMIMMIIMMIFLNIMMILIEHFTSSKNFTFFLCVYKMVNINKDTYENNNINVNALVDDKATLWLN